jgi:hypothetical protein
MAKANTRPFEKSELFINLVMDSPMLLTLIAG